MSETLDLGALTITDAELPERAGGAGKPAKYANVVNPFDAVLDESRATGKGKSVTVPAVQVKDVVLLLRRAAKNDDGSTKHGLRIVYADRHGNILTADDVKNSNDQKHITVGFQAQRPKNYGPRKRKSKTEDVAVPESGNVFDGMNLPNES